MKTNILYSEKQRFNMWYVTIPLLIIIVTMIYGLISQLVFGKSFGNNPASDLELILITLFILLFTIPIFFIRLDTEIDHEGIRVRLFPFHIAWKQYTWRQILKAWVREYKPIAEYGGWGLKGSGKNRAYNISGNKGLQLEFEDGTRLLIGTAKPESVQKALEEVERRRNELRE